MIFTQRQLEALHNGNGQVLLPYRARLTPLAQDWVRKRKVEIGYAEIEPNLTAKPGAASPLPAEPPSAAASFVWWCDGPCGPAKAAIAGLSREANLAAMEMAMDGKHLVAAVKELAELTKGGKTSGGVLLVKSGASAMVLANRCSSLRAVLGTCLDSVEQGITQMAANVLVLEHPYQTLMQARNLIGRFVRAKRVLSDEIKEQLHEVSACACK